MGTEERNAGKVRTMLRAFGSLVISSVIEICRVVIGYRFQNAHSDRNGDSVFLFNIQDWRKNASAGREKSHHHGGFGGDR